MPFCYYEQKHFNVWQARSTTPELKSGLPEALEGIMPSILLQALKMMQHRVLNAMWHC